MQSHRNSPIETPIRKDHAMIKVSVYYPNEEGKKFDIDYYTNKHMALVHEKLDSLGLIRGEVEKDFMETPEIDVETVFAVAP